MHLALEVIFERTYKQSRHRCSRGTVEAELRCAPHWEKMRLVQTVSLETIQANATMQRSRLLHCLHLYCVFISTIKQYTLFYTVDDAILQRAIVETWHRHVQLLDNITKAQKETIFQVRHHAFSFHGWPYLSHMSHSCLLNPLCLLDATADNFASTTMRHCRFGRQANLLLQATWIAHLKFI